VAPATVPVEGYYAEEPELTEYFLIMRALQSVEDSRRGEVAGLREWQRLLQVTSSALFGTQRPSTKLLPRGVDPLGKALENASEWTLDALVPAARAAALANDDCSLVGLAARASDALVITATRESVVLYAMGMFLGLSQNEPRFEWQVDDELASAATRFVRMFNELFAAHVPLPQPDNAAAFWNASERADVLGRCVRIGWTPDEANHYHWAICDDRELRPRVQEFWASEIWTTERYRERMGSDRWCPDLGL
jgi:hypothetical protein